MDARRERKYRAQHCDTGGLRSLAVNITIASNVSSVHARAHSRRMVQLRDFLRKFAHHTCVNLSIIIFASAPPLVSTLAFSKSSTAQLSSHSLARRISYCWVMALSQGRFIVVSGKSYRAIKNRPLPYVARLASRRFFWCFVSWSASSVCSEKYLDSSKNRSFLSLPCA